MKLDALKEQHNRFKELFKALLIAIITLISGMILSFYQILTHKVPAYIAFFNLIGIIILFLLGLYVRIVWLKMDKIEEEMLDV